MVIIGLGNGLSPFWCQAITWTTDDFLFSRPWGTPLSEILKSPNYYLGKCSCIRYKACYLSLNFLSESLQNCSILCSFNPSPHPIEPHRIEISRKFNHFSSKFCFKYVICWWAAMFGKGLIASKMHLNSYSKSYSLIGPWRIWLQSQISKVQTHYNDKYLSIFCEIAIRWMPQHLTDY